MSDVNQAINWVDSSPYCKAMGMEVVMLDSERAVFSLPFQPINANTTGALHGGVAASLGLCAGQAVARAAMGPESGPWHTVELQINYLAAAMNETVEVEATVLRRGKDLCFLRIDVHGEDRKMVASLVSMVRGRWKAPPATLRSATIDTPRSGPAPLREPIERNPFISARGIRMPYQGEGGSFLVMPWNVSNGEADGGLHEGAVVSLLDTAGAMAAWGVTGAGPFKASTASLQAQILSPIPAVDLEARARVFQRDREIFWSDVEVASAATGNVYARGTLGYRIVT